MNYSHKIVMVSDGVNIGTDLSNVGVGDILMLDKDYAAIATSVAAGTAGSTDAEIQIVTKNAKKNVIAHKIKRSNVISAQYSAGTEATQKVQTIGFNGTSGSLVSDTGVFSTASKAFGINFVVNEDYRQLPQKLLNVMGSYQTAPSGSTQFEVVSYIYRQLIKNELLAPLSPMQIAKVELLHNNAGAAIGAAADTVVGAAGSRTVTVTDTAANASVTAIPVGSLFRAGTATTDPVYEVVASTVTTSGGVLTLNTPLLAAVNLVGNTSEFITTADVLTGNFGFRFTGVALPITNKFDNYSVVDFDVFANLGFASTTTKTTITAKSLGVGVGADVYRQEIKFYSAENPTVNFRDFPQDDLALNATNSASALYDILVLRYNKDAGDNFMQSSEKMFPQTLVIAITKDAAQGVIATANTFMSKVTNWLAKNVDGDTTTWADVG
jgi:hypothetical protein